MRLRFFPEPVDVLVALAFGILSAQRDQHCVGMRSSASTLHEAFSTEMPSVTCTSPRVRGFFRGGYPRSVICLRNTQGCFCSRHGSRGVSTTCRPSGLRTDVSGSRTPTRSDFDRFTVVVTLRDVGRIHSLRRYCTIRVLLFIDNSMFFFSIGK